MNRPVLDQEQREFLGIREPTNNERRALEAALAQHSLPGPVDVHDIDDEEREEIADDLLDSKGRSLEVFLADGVDFHLQIIHDRGRLVEVSHIGKYPGGED